MNRIKVNVATCNRCGLCIQVCPAQHLTLEGDTVQEMPFRECIACGHCVAICPVDALAHRDLSASGFDRLDPGAVPRPDALRAFLRQRRSTRRYQDRAVPREAVEELLEVARYAPTAHNAQNVGFLATDDQPFIQHLADLTVDAFRTIVAQLRNPPIRTALTLSVGKELAQQTLGSVPDFERLVATREAGGDPIFRRAPVLLVAHADKNEYFGRDNCLYATYNVMLEAVARGLGTCLIGYFIVAWDRDRRVREALGLPKGHRAYAACTLGYPAVRYRRVVPRRPVGLAWQPEEGTAEHAADAEKI
ncbi:MAG: nitroreductase family protein [Anaerolineae bacterium]